MVHLGPGHPRNTSWQTWREEFDVEAAQSLQVAAHWSTSSSQRQIGGIDLVHGARSQQFHGLHIGPGLPTYLSLQTKRDGCAVDGTQLLHAASHCSTSSAQWQIGGIDLVHGARSQHFHGLAGAGATACKTSSSRTSKRNQERKIDGARASSADASRTLGVAREANGGSGGGVAGDEEGSLERKHQQDASTKPPVHLHGWLLGSACLCIWSWVARPYI
jgi:hypothetical protein